MRLLQRHGGWWLFLTGAALIVIGLVEGRNVVVVSGAVLMACAVAVSRFAPSPPPTVSQQIRGDVEARIVDRYGQRHQRE